MAMTSAEWERKIKSYCRKAGTYKPFFISVISTLADIMEKRDQAQERFEESGGDVMIEYTNKAGATNMIQNPMIKLINEYNRDALAYWRDLGLTPAGYKKLNAEVVEDKKGGSLEKLLEKIAT